MEKQSLKKKLRIRNKWNHSNIKISKELRDIIHGYVMSDGFLSKKGALQITQSQQQKRFVEWLYNKLRVIRTEYPIQDAKQIQVKTRKPFFISRFNTRCLLHGFCSMWYRLDENNRSKKKLPESINCFFNATFISVWFAGDGTKIIGSFGAKFEVTAFTAKERQKLKNLFLTKFGIITRIISSGKSTKGRAQWALTIPASEYQKFRALIASIDLIPNVFPYKLHKKD